MFCCQFRSGESHFSQESVEVAPSSCFFDTSDFVASPKEGRFLSRNPISNNQSLNQEVRWWKMATEED
jgi:hypothetical protein